MKRFAQAENKNKSGSRVRSESTNIHRGMIEGE
jgi:hypothetical protein